MSVSILILTLNEESNIPACLDAIKWCDDIVILDSFSSDKTTALAMASGARIETRKFDDWSSHQNWALEHIRYKHKWVFYLDADERMTDELRREIESIANDANESRVAFYCGRKNYFMGRWIKHAYPPSSLLRFFIPDKVRFRRLVHPWPEIQGEHGYLKSFFLHYSFSKGMSDWFDKHNKYSQFEAVEATKQLDGLLESDASLFSSDKFKRRIALKILSFRMPFRPWLKFIYLYFLKFGILDGIPGLTYCALQSVYEYMIVLKMKEIRRREKGLTL